MLIIMMALIAAVALAVVCLRRDKISLLILALCGSFIVMLTGIVIYTAKIGGFSRSQQITLFLLPKIQQYLQYLPISLDIQGYLAAVGRCCFPCILLLIALNYSMSPLVHRYFWSLRVLAFGAGVWLVYYYPPVFRFWVRGRWGLQQFMGNLSLIWIVVCVLLAMLLLVHEYRNIFIPYFKKNFRYILLSYVSMAFLYLIYVIHDPAQIYQFYGLEFLWIWRGSYTTGMMDSFTWAALGLCSVFFVILGSINLLRYTRVAYNEDLETVYLQSKIDQTRLGASVFVHSIKNQLLSNRVLNKKLDQELTRPEPSIDKIRELAGELNNMNETMVARMEELYRAIRTNSILLVPVSLREVADAAISRFHQKYPDCPVSVNIKNEGMILADKAHLSEALYNLLCNGQEAILESERKQQGDLRLVVQSQRLHTVLEICDNGRGISRANRFRIYEPFYTSKNTSYNWGMGLYYVRNIVKGHYGTLKVESRPGKGTHFYIMLPRYDGGSDRQTAKGGSKNGRKDQDSDS